MCQLNYNVFGLENREFHQVMMGYGSLVMIGLMAMILILKMRNEHKSSVHF